MENAEFKGPKVVFHLGLPKTGSTSIQEMLKLNADWLITKGIKVETKGGLSKPLREATRAFARRGGVLLRARYRFELWRFGRRVRGSNVSCLLISDENILAAEPAQLFAASKAQGFEQRLRDLERALGPKLRPRHVIYMREREAWRASAYTQTLKRATHNEDYVTWCTHNTDLTGPDRIVDHLSAVVGPRLVVVDMQTELASGEPFGASILAECGLSSDDMALLAQPKAKNVSPPDAALEFIKILHKNGIRGRTYRRIWSAILENPKLFALPPETKDLDR